MNIKLKMFSFKVLVVVHLLALTRLGHFCQHVQLVHCLTNKVNLSTYIPFNHLITYHIYVSRTHLYLITLISFSQLWLLGAYHNLFLPWHLLRLLRAFLQVFIIYFNHISLAFFIKYPQLPLLIFSFVSFVSRL